MLEPPIPGTAPGASARGGPRIPSGRFGEYVLVKKLGEGGMAEVFLAEMPRGAPGRRHAALKLAKPEGEVPPGVDPAELFAAEADVMGLLRHPNLVELFEVGKHDGRLFLAMEYVQGADLASFAASLRARQRPFPPSLALHVGIDVLKGLSYLHQAQTVRGAPLNLVHGDVNPSNVLLSAESGRAKLSDFGVATTTALAGGLPEGTAAGKLHYLSPEQAHGKSLSPGSDLFAVGVVMYELLLGWLPFEGAEPAQVIEKICSGKYMRPFDLSDQLEAIFERALAKSLRNRYQTAGAFAADLLRYQLDNDLQATPEDLCAALADLAAPAL